MRDNTITQWVDHFIGKYPTKEDFKIDLDRIINDLTKDKESNNQLAFYKRLRNKYIKRH